MIAEALRRKLPVFTTYGLTEMASQVATMPFVAAPDKRATSGKVLRHRQLEIAPDGEILVRGATLFAGYVDESGIDPGVDADGWFHTGDLGALDGEGFLTVNGRKDFMFISGGENIHPEEIEKALLALSGIERAAVVPVDDPEFGQRPVAFLKTDGPLPNRDELKRLLSDRIEAFKVPVAVLPWPDSVETPSGKFDRKALAKRAAAKPI